MGGDCVTIQMLQDFVIAVAESLVMEGETERLYPLVTNLCRVRLVNREYWKSWRSNFIAAGIDSSRLDKNVP